MALGFKTAYFTTAALAKTSDATLVTTGLTSPIPAGQTQTFRAFLPITVGAAGGVRLQVVVPAAGVIYDLAIKLLNTILPGQVLAFQSASAVFTDALANAGTHWIELTGTVVNGATDGTVDIQIAQNTSNASALTLLRGASMDVVGL